MRVLVDECFSGHLVEALRDAGHDVSWAAEVCSGVDDGAVLACAFSEKRLVVTLDRGIGERAARGEAAVGVVVVGSGNAGQTLPEIAQSVARRLEAIGEIGLVGKLTILETDRTRQRNLPAVADRT